MLILLGVKENLQFWKVVNKLLKLKYKLGVLAIDY